MAAHHTFCDGIDGQVHGGSLQYPIESTGNFARVRCGTEHPEQLVGGPLDVGEGPTVCGRHHRPITTGRSAGRRRESIDERNELVGREGCNVDHEHDSNAWTVPGPLQSL